MYCPNCGETIPENALFCIHCGNALPLPQPEITAGPVYAPPAEPENEPAPPPVYGTHRAPILFMAVLVVLGLVLFLLTSGVVPLISGEISELFFVQCAQ